jgi:hypothetical protein
VTNEESLPVAGVWVVQCRKNQRESSITCSSPLRRISTGHFDLRGLAPGKYKLFSWDGVEQGEWEDTDFLKDSEEKGVTIDLNGSDTKAIAMKLIQLKNAATARE